MLYFLMKERWHSVNQIALLALEDILNFGKTTKSRILSRSIKGKFLQSMFPFWYSNLEKKILTVDDRHKVMTIAYMAHRTKWAKNKI
jgi:hypothetical protein